MTQIPTPPAGGANAQVPPMEPPVAPPPAPAQDWPTPTAGVYPAAEHSAQPQQNWPQALRPRALGVVAMIAGIAVFVLSPIASVFIGIAAGPVATATENSFSFSADTASPNPAIAILGVSVLLHIGLGSVIGVWSIVQGIIAVATKRGRAYGVVAIVLAAVAPILSFIVYTIAIAASLPQR